MLVKIKVLDNAGKLAAACQSGINAEFLTQNIDPAQKDCDADLPKFSARQIAFHALTLMYKLKIKAPVQEVCKAIHRVATIAWSFESTMNGNIVTQEVFCKSDIEFTIDQNGCVTYQRYIDNKCDGASMSWVNSTSYQ